LLGAPKELRAVHGKPVGKLEAELPRGPVVEEEDDDIVSISSEESDYGAPPWMKGKVRSVVPKRDRERPPTTRDYVGLAKAKKAAARAEKRLQRARLDNLAALGEVPSKSLEAALGQRNWWRHVSISLCSPPQPFWTRWTRPSETLFMFLIVPTVLRGGSFSH